MLKPSYFYGKTDKIVSYYQDLEDFLLADIAKFLLTAGELGGTADRNLFIIQQMGMNNATIVAKLAELTNKSRNEIRRLLQDSAMTSFSSDKEVLGKYYNEEFGMLNNPAVVHTLNAEWIKTQGELNNLTMTAMAQYNKDLVRLLNEAEIRVASGAQSYSSAICDILDQYSKTGFVVDYPSGTRRSLESAVRCAVVTSMNQTAGQVTNQYIAQNDVEYVIITAHMGARHDDKNPEGLQSHDWWQGKMFKIVGSEEGYPNLLESTGYSINPSTGAGTVVNPLGLHGYNCRHSHSPAFKGMRNPWQNEDGTPRIDPAESQEVYEMQQNQRAMERGIRQNKRQLNMKQLEIDNLPDDSIEKANALADYDHLAYKLRQRNAQYNRYCQENGLTRQQDRVKVAGFTKADAQKANGRATAYNEMLNSYYGTFPKKWVSNDLVKNDANLMAKINPNYNPFASINDPYSKNCSACTVAYVLRKKYGFNVEACPINKNSSKHLLKAPWDAWEIDKNNILPFDNKDDIINLLKDSENAIYQLIYKHKSSAGHSIIVEVENRKISFLDVQKNKIFDANYLDSNSVYDIKMWRVDNVEVSQRGITSCVMKN